MTTTFVSTSIPYVNAPPHVGFALELVQADALARSRRQRGHDVFLLTGTDENALKNVQVARAAGLTPRQLCDRNAPFFQRLVAALDVSADGFVRTSSAGHHAGARKLWTACRPDDLFRQAYTGLYCLGCEDFYAAQALTDGLCPVHGTPPEPVREENWFFRLSAYQADLEARLTSGALRVLPEARRNEALAFVRRGLRPYSVSRSRERTGGWGVEVPGDPGQTQYVWFDALASYLTGLGYGTDAADAFERYWLGSGERIHVIGKDILRFHAACWPATLASAGLPPPTCLCVHGFLTVGGEKISKSRGAAVDPFPLIERYGADALRYALLRCLPTGADGDFSEERLGELYTADLANGLGNLVRRIETLCERGGYDEAPGPRPSPPPETGAAVDAFQLTEALEGLWRRVAALNQGIERVRPWELLAEGEAAGLRSSLAGWVAETRLIAAGLAPFLPSTAARIEASLAARPVRVGPALFPRLSPRGS